MELKVYNNMVYIKYLISVVLLFPCLVLAIDLDGLKANIDKYDVELNFKDGGDLDLLIENEEIYNIELLQKRATVDFYFKMIFSYKKGQGLKPTGINIYSKKSGQLLQTITNLQGIDWSVSGIDSDYFKANIDKYDVDLDFYDDGYISFPIKNEEINNIELLQKRSTDDFYFKMILSYKKGQGLKPTGLNIYSKKSGQLFQTINNLKGFDFLGEYSIGAVNHIDDSYRFAPDYFDHNGIEIDYNFDGNYNDFYIARAVDDMEDAPIIYRYYSYDKKKNKFIYLNLDGRYIDFDSSKKIAKRKKICEINNYSAVILNETYRFKAESSNYTLTNSTCTYKEYESFRGFEGQAFKISRQCSQKEKNFCIKENELDKDFD